VLKAAFLDAAGTVDGEFGLGVECSGGEGEQDEEEDSAAHA
jgi:hypothetical protein